MTTIRILWFLISALFFLVISTHLPCSAETRKDSGDLIVIGMIVDQTGPAAEAAAYSDAVRNYFRNINDQGGINGKKIKLILEDDRYTIPGAFAAFKKLVFKDNVLTILGCGGTGQTTALFSNIKKNRMPVNTLSWSWTMTDPVKRYIFTANNDNKDEIKIIMDYIINIVKQKAIRIAIVSHDAEYGKSGIKVARMKAKQYDVKLVQSEILPLGALEACSQVLNLKRRKVTHIINLTFPGPTLALLREAKRLRYSPIIIGSFHLFTDEVAEIGGGVTEKVYGVGAYGSWHDDTEGIDELKKISFKYTPNMKVPNRYYTKGWITARITHEGIKRAGKDIDGESLVNALETIKNMDMKGLTGPISYSAKDHKGNSCARVYKADSDKGYFVPVTDWIEAK